LQATTRRSAFFKHRTTIAIRSVYEAGIDRERTLLGRCWKCATSIRHRRRREPKKKTLSANLLALSACRAPRRMNIEAPVRDSKM